MSSLMGRLFLLSVRNTFDFSRRGKWCSLSCGGSGREVVSASLILRVSCI